MNMKKKFSKISAERKAIVKYLRDVAEMYDNDFNPPQTSHVISVCATDIEESHPDTEPPPKPKKLRKK